MLEKAYLNANCNEAQSCFFIETKVTKGQKTVTIMESLAFIVTEITQAGTEQNGEAANFHFDHFHHIQAHSDNDKKWHRN